MHMYPCLSTESEWTKTPRYPCGEEDLMPPKGTSLGTLTDGRIADMGFPVRKHRPSEMLVLATEAKRRNAYSVDSLRTSIIEKLRLATLLKTAMKLKRKTVIANLRERK